ncbi:amino acid transporter [Lysobacter bugurensis]|uniref:Amino acid transporter n=2 Tax=Cognatilysobacter bugurensis TaxID=543356 RepID=A0A918SZ24_9GAMM|nr:amino acid transporter [Lysobacter bugurensis]
MDMPVTPAVQRTVEAPRPVLHARAAFAIAIGIVVGAGIFRTPSLVAGAAATEAVFLGAWLVGGLLSIVGALCYAELASTYPQAGGDYTYLQRAFGPRTAFLYAWARLAVIQTGSIALLAYVAGDYLAQLVSIGPMSAPVYAAAAVVVLTAINWLGVKQGTSTQNWLTAIEVGGLVAIVLAGLLFAPDAPVAATPASSGDAYGLILVFVLLTYGGWSEAVYVSAEVRDAPRVMPRILVLSLTAIAVLYLLVNLAYLRVLGLGGIAASETVAADAMQAVFGAPGATAISALVVAAALTSANATLITGARSAYAVGRDFPALSMLGRWDAESGSPRNAVLVQGALALLLVGLGAFARDGFRTAVEYTAPVFWLFFLLVGISLFVLRARDPQAPRVFRVPLYPLLPLLFCATSAYLLYSSLAYTGLGALVGVAVLAVGGLLLVRLRPASP